MRELHVHVSGDDRRVARTILDEHGVDFVSMPDGDGGALFVFTLPTAAVSTILGELREAGIGEGSYTVMTKIEMAETPGFTELLERFSGATRKLSMGELHAKVRELQWPTVIYYVGTVLSVTAAAAALLLDQVALLIGAMIIAPQASSALSAPAGALLGDWEMYIDSLREQVLGLGLAIVCAGVFGWFVRWTGFVPPLLSLSQVELVGVRFAPTFLSTVGAVIAGIVGAFGYTTEQSTSLIGVMIAAALIPAAALTGLALAWAAPLVAIGSFLLLLVNIIAINVGSFATLVAMGYDPDWRRERASLRNSIPSGRHTAVYVTVVLLALSTVGAGFLTATNVAFSRSVNQEVQSTLERPVYGDLLLSGVSMEYGGALAGTGPTEVTVDVRRTTGRAYPDLAGRLERRIERRTGRDVSVTLAFTESRSANATRPSTARAAAT